MLVAQQQTVNGQRRTIAQRDATIAEHRHASTEHQRTIAERDVVIAELKRTITERNAKIARISEHSRWLEYHSRQVTTMATAAVAAHNSITLGNGAPPGNVGPDEDAPSRDDAAPRDDTFPRDDNAAMSDESSGDDLDNAATGADDDDLVDAASGADDTTAGDATGAAATDDAASGADDDDLADEIAESLHVAKRRRLDQQVCDDSEQVITSEDLLEIAGPIVFTDIDVLASIYEALKDRPLIPTRVAPEEFTRRLARLEGFARWTPRFTEAESSELTGLNLLRRSDREIESLRPNVLRQLGLEGQPGAVVLGPRLWFVLVSMIGLPLERMTGRILEKAFKKLINKSLCSLLVVTRNSVRKMSPGELWNLAKTWARKLIEFIVEDDGTRHLQEAATQCNRYYMSQCLMDANGARSDPTGNIAMEVLDGRSDCRLFLGLDGDTYDIEALCKRFFAIADGGVDQHTAACLRQVADS